MVKRLSRAASFGIFCCYPALCQREISSLNSPRPLSALSVRLADLGYAVTYEEAPYDHADLITDVRPSGQRYLHIRFLPVAFHLASGTPQGEVSPVNPSPLQSQQKALDHATLLRMIQEYNDSGNPGRFRVIFEGDYAHIVPSSRTVDGRTVDFQPILSTRVQMPPGPTSCMTALQDLFLAIRTSREVNVVDGRMPIGSFIRAQCTVSGQNLTARDILIQILAQASTCCTPNPEGFYTWGLLHDANWNQYFLSAKWVPNQPSTGPDAGAVRSTGAGTGLGGTPKGQVLIKQP